VQVSTGTQLLDRLTAKSSRHGPLLAPLGEVLTPFARAFWPSGLRPEPLAVSADSCLVVESAHVRQYHRTGSTGWADYAAIVRRFEQNRRQRGSASGSNATVLPRELVDADVKLIVRDSDRPLECAVVWERVYPKRAWVGTTHPSLDHHSAFVIAGILNSAIGQVLYRRRARSHQSRTGDLRKGMLTELLVPVLGYDIDAFARVALLSYRLHCLHAANRDCLLPSEVLDVDIPSHQIALLSELVRLFGYPDKEARQLVEEVLPAGLPDVPGMQRKLYYVAREAMRPVSLMSEETHTRYERLKEVAGTRPHDEPEAAEFSGIQALIRWQNRINLGVPEELRPTPWPGVSDANQAIEAAFTYLSFKKGQAYGAERARRIDGRFWEVDIYHSPPAKVAPHSGPRVPDERRGLQRLPAGKLRVDGVTGQVREVLEDAGHALDSGD
jgi:hypothetical protein